MDQYLPIMLVRPAAEDDAIVLLAKNIMESARRITLIMENHRAARARIDVADAGTPLEVGKPFDLATADPSDKVTQAVRSEIVPILIQACSGDQTERAACLSATASGCRTS